MRLHCPRGTNCVPVPNVLISSKSSRRKWREEWPTFFCAGSNVIREGSRGSLSSSHCDIKSISSSWAIMPSWSSWSRSPCLGEWLLWFALWGALLLSLLDLSLLRSCGGSKWCIADVTAIAYGDGGVLSLFLARGGVEEERMEATSRSSNSSHVVFEGVHGDLNCLNSSIDSGVGVCTEVMGGCSFVRESVSSSRQPE
jgi:hypothetical protein